MVKGKDFVFTFAKTGQQYTFNLSPVTLKSIKYFKATMEISAWVQQQKENHPKGIKWVEKAEKISEKEKQTKKENQILEEYLEYFDHDSKFMDELNEKWARALFRTVMNSWDVPGKFNEKNVVQVLGDYPEITDWIRTTATDSNNFAIEKIVKN